MNDQWERLTDLDLVSPFAEGPAEAWPGSRRGDESSGVGHEEGFEEGYAEDREGWAEGGEAWAEDREGWAEGPEAFDEVEAGAVHEHGGHGEAPAGHRCAAGEGPPARGARSLIYRGSGASSRNPSVGYAQQLLNRFLVESADRHGPCVDRSPARLAYMTDLRRRLQQNRQDPLVVDCRFGPNTENATKLFQACFGLVRDGRIGPVTWHYLERHTRGGAANPPDSSSCGVPPRPSAELEHELDVELEALQEAPRRTAVRARLSLFQNATTTSHRNHFQCQASRVARLLSAYADPRADRCSPRRVGPTAYSTGADIVDAISAAHACLRQRVSAVHVFGHSGSYGIFGSASGGAVGLYVSTDAASRAAGARTIADIPAAALADDVVVVLHGCNQASGSDSFAQRLYEHLATSLRRPVVFAHPNSGCAGRDNSWRRFSSARPGGQAVRSIAPHYSGDGCCSPSSSEAFEPAAELEHGLEAYAEGEAFAEGTAAERRPCRCQH